MVLPVLGMGLGGAVAALVGVIRRMQHRLWLLQKQVDSVPEVLGQPYDDTEIRSLLDTLTQAVGSGIKEVDRNNRRIEAVVRRARSELEESGLVHPGLEAAAGELRLLDGAGGEEGEVPEVPEDVGAPPAYDPPSGVPGFTKSELKAWRERMIG